MKVEVANKPEDPQQPRCIGLSLRGGYTDCRVNGSKTFDKACGCCTFQTKIDCNKLAYQYINHENTLQYIYKNTVQAC